jgi:hypothetical protein
VKKNNFILIGNIAILVLFVTAVFFLLHIFEGKIFTDAKEKKANLDPKNIYLSLLENYESLLLNLRTNLKQEENSLIEQLNSTYMKSQKAEIEGKIKELEDKYKQAEIDLISLNDEKKNTSSNGNKSDLINDLTREKESLSNKMFDLKIFWNDYVNNIKSTLLDLHEEKNYKEKVNTAFSIDYGKNYISEILKEYSINEKEIEKLKKESANNVDTDSGKTSDKEELDKLVSDNRRLQEMVKELEDNVKDLKGSLNAKMKNIKDMENNIIAMMNDIKDRESEIKILIDQSDINGFFINKDDKPFLIINNKKADELVDTGTFTVYDLNKKEVSKIYLSRKGQQIVMTKLPGYETPKPGNWF